MCCVWKMQGPIHMKRQLSHNKMKSRRPVVDTTGNIDPPPSKIFFSPVVVKSRVPGCHPSASHPDYKEALLW
jgi:hypothetical protein